MYGIALLFVGMSCIAVADLLDDGYTALMAMVGAWITVAGIAVCTLNYGRTHSTFYSKAMWRSLKSNIKQRWNMC